MKKLIILIGIIAASLSGWAQGIDSTEMAVTITVPRSVHTHAIRCLGLSGLSSPDRINYINDLIEQGYNTKADTAKITVSVPAGMIIDVFRAASMKSEGVVVTDNAAAETALLPQVQGNSWIMSQLMSIKMANMSTNVGEKNSVVDYMKKIKP